MLILTRRIGEILRIGDDVKVTVLAVQGNQVRIGVDAPRDVAVHREEIYQRIQQGKYQKAPAQHTPSSASTSTPTLTTSPTSEAVDGQRTNTDRDGIVNATAQTAKKLKSAHVIVKKIRLSLSGNR